MSKKSSQPPEQVDEAQYPDSPPSTNPAGLKVTVTVPASINTKLVDASVLADYEVWALVASITGNFLVGFFVAFLQSGRRATKDLGGLPRDGVLFWFSLLCFLLFLIFAIMAFSKRKELLNQETRVVYRS